MHHHVFELMIDAAWTHLFGDKKSKDNTECKAFQEIWAEIDLDKEVHTLPFMTDEIEIEMKEATVGILTSILEEPDSKNQLPRDDYREAAELALVMLGITPRRWDKPRWGSCGAFHHARWMHLLLYGPKMLAFHDQCDWMDEGYVVKLQRFLR